jgi:hypothetical protein
VTKDDDPQVSNELPEKQPPRGRGNSRGKSDKSDPTEGDPGEVDAENDPTVIDESPADEEGNRVEHHRDDPNTYPDPENPSHTP